jgi:hypothetical protein
MSKGLRSILCAGAVSLTAAVVPTAQARPQTTTPGIVYVVKTVITDTKVTIARDQFTRHGVHRLPRGAQIRYAITNKGTKAYALKMWETVSPVMKPGGHAALFVNWQFRGTYRFVLLYHGKPAGPKGVIVIF